MAETDENGVEGTAVFLILNTETRSHRVIFSFRVRRSRELRASSGLFLIECYGALCLRVSVFKKTNLKI